MKITKDLFKTNTTFFKKLVKFQRANSLLNIKWTSKSNLLKPVLHAFMFSVVLASCAKMDRRMDNVQLSKIITDSKSGMGNYNNWIINTVAGSDVYGYAGDGGKAADATLNSPQNVYVDKKGNVYLTDLGNSRIRKIEVGTDKIITVAGNGSFGFSGDNGLATEASLLYAFHTAVDDDGNLYISDLANNRIRKVDVKSGIITTIAGTGIPGFNGDGHDALATNLSEPFGIAFDKNKNLLITDQDGLRLRIMNMKTKVITTIAGNGERGYRGDGGPASQAIFNFIWNVAVDDESGDIYVSDESNYRIRKIDYKSGKIMSFAGNGISGNSGLGGLAANASFTDPVGIAVDKKGNLFVSDQVLNQIYVVDKKSGVINLIAGNGTTGFSGDGGLAINSQLSHPNSLSLNPDGNLYICDANNNRIRKIYNPKE
jgi:sugar lactone lactonase YvrE